MQLAWEAYALHAVHSMRSPEFCRSTLTCTYIWAYSSLDLYKGRTTLPPCLSGPHPTPSRAGPHLDQLSELVYHLCRCRTMCLEQVLFRTTLALPCFRGIKRVVRAEKLKYVWLQMV